MNHSRTLAKTVAHSRIVNKGDVMKSHAVRCRVDHLPVRRPPHHMMPPRNINSRPLRHMPAINRLTSKLPHHRENVPLATVLFGTSRRIHVDIIERRVTKTLRKVPHVRRFNIGRDHGSSNSPQNVEWWHRRREARFQIETLSPVATHDLLGLRDSPILAPSQSLNAEAVGFNSAVSLNQSRRSSRRSGARRCWITSASSEDIGDQL